MEGAHTGQIHKGPVAASRDHSYPTLPREEPERAGIKGVALVAVVSSLSL